MNFKAGDKVKVPWSDNVYTVGIFEYPHDDFPVNLYFEGECCDEYFTLDGKLCPSHEKPVLQLVEKAKQPVEYYFYTYRGGNHLSLSEDISSSIFFSSLPVAKDTFESELKKGIRHDLQFHKITRME